MRQLITCLVRATCVRYIVLAVLVLLVGAHPATLRAQTAGEGTITGTVTDSTGAVSGEATVTATNTSTNVSTSRTTSSAGLYTIAPLPPGTYTVTVEAKGFKTLKQENLDVVGLAELAFNPALSIGATSETVDVTTAPPVLDTDSAILARSWRTRSTPICLSFNPPRSSAIQLPLQPWFPVRNPVPAHP